MDRYKKNLTSNDYRKRSEISDGNKVPLTRSHFPPNVLAKEHRQRTSTKLKDTQGHSKQTIIFWPVGLFLILLCVPVYLFVGSIRLPPYRLLLLITIVPCLLLCLTSKRSFADMLILLYVSWAATTIFLNQPWPGSLETSGSLFVDVAGSYFLARLLITTPFAFRKMCNVLFLAVGLMGVFAAVESVTGNNLVLKFFGSFFNAFSASDMEFRMGLRRAQGPFEHPILYGVFCSAVFGLCIYVLGPSSTQRQNIRRIVTVSLATFFSLSTGAYLSLISQIAFITWDKLFQFGKHRWKFLLLLFFCGYVIVDALSNRTPAEVFISYLTFDSATSYNRVLIWRYGIEEVYRNPIYGMGTFSDWIRPDWMVGSIDNFWLLRTMRHGIPGGLFLVWVTAYIIIKLSKAKIVEAEVDACRRGILTAIGGLCIALTTVDVWNSTHCFFWFLLGSAVWITFPEGKKLEL